METISVHFVNPRTKKMECKTVLPEQVIGCIAIYKDWDHPGTTVLSHIPSGRAIMAFEDGTSQGTQEAIAREFNALLENAVIPESNRPGPVLNGGDLYDAAVDIFHRYNDYWKPTRWGDSI